MKLNDLYLAIMALQRHFGREPDTLIKDGHISIFTQRLPSDGEIETLERNGWIYQGGTTFVLTNNKNSFYA